MKKDDYQKEVTNGPLSNARIGRLWAPSAYIFSLLSLQFDACPREHHALESERITDML